MLILACVFGTVWYQYYSETIVLPFYRRGNWVLIGIYAAFSTVFFKAYGGFKIGYLKRTDMLYSQIISIACVNFITYFLISLIGRNFMRPMPILIMTLIDIAIVGFWTFLTGELYFTIYPPRQLVILYGGGQAADLVIKMSRRIDKYMICNAIQLSLDETDSSIENIKKQLLEYEGVIICDISPSQRNDFIKFCFENSVRTYISPKISDIIIRSADDIRLFDTPLLLCRNYGLTVEQRFFKRISDVLLSSAVLLIALPIMLVTAIAVKISDGGAVFYKQKRLTEGGRVFSVYKFRSMIADAEKDGRPMLATDGDSRITPVGRVLRKFRIDELPQLLNVLKGDMSLVGPRPERPELAAEYAKTMPEFVYRLKVKAGLTGYAQVTGVYDTSNYDKLKMDLMYIENYSVRMDLQIILMTLKTIVFPSKNNNRRADK